MITFDTNVLLYAADRRAARKQTIAQQILDLPGPSMLLWQVACEFISASRKLAAHGFTQHEAWDQLAHYRRTYPLILPTPEILERARDLHARQWSFWDAMIAAACLEAGVKRLYTEDMPGAKPPDGLEIVNPFA